MRYLFAALLFVAACSGLEYPNPSPREACEDFRAEVNEMFTRCGVRAEVTWSCSYYDRVRNESDLYGACFDALSTQCFPDGEGSLPDVCLCQLWNAADHGENPCD